MKSQEVQNKLAGSGLPVFTKVEFRRIIGGTQVSSQKILERYTKYGILVRLKGGLYYLASNKPSEYLIANKLYIPSYISFETALSYYGIIPETVYSITCATTKTTRTYQADRKDYVYHSIKKKAYRGYELRVIGGQKVFIAEKEKALADYLYLAFLSKREINDRLNMRNLDKKKIMGHIKIFDNRRFKEWAKNVI